MDTRAQHTPGPWEVDGPGIYEASRTDTFAVELDGALRTHRHGLVALAYERYGVDGVRATDGANARLIAAAPDLLAALGAILDNTIMQNTLAAQARAAIAKATGTPSSVAR